MIITLPYAYLSPRITRAGGQGARIRNDSQKAIDRSATISSKTQMIRNDQLESDMKQMQGTCCKLQGVTPQVMYANGGDRWLHWLEINFA